MINSKVKLKIVLFVIKILNIEGDFTISQKTSNFSTNNIINNNHFQKLPPGWTSFEFEILRLTNVERQNHGLKPLKPHSGLHHIAQQWSSQMKRRNKLKHGAAGKRIKTVFKNSFYAENVAKGYNTPKDYVTSWMNSPGHRKNILNPNFAYLGVGNSSDNSFSTQDFSSEEIAIN